MTERVKIGEMGIDEEDVLFYFALGVAISQWGYVERILCSLAVFDLTNEQKMPMTEAFYSIENFRSKLAFADRLLSAKFDGLEFLDRWVKLNDRLQKASFKRNKLAHYRPYVFPHARIGKRHVLIPGIDIESREWPPTGGPPPEALCVRDVWGISAEFHSIGAAIMNLVYDAEKNPDKLPESLEQPESPPKIRELRLQIREALGLLPKSSPE